MKLAIVGATGLVGSTMLQVLEERNFPVSEFIPVASSRSLGQPIEYMGKSYAVHSPEQALDKRPDLVLFSAGGDVSRQLAPRFTEIGSYVIDNSSAWRMDPTVPLIVPEVNGHRLVQEQRLIANPNCSTIQLVMVLHPLHEAYKIRRVVVSTYQSVSGSGQKGVIELKAQREGGEGRSCFPHRIDLNLIPHIDQFLDSGYTREEEKMVNETRKILDDESIRITATAVRVPVISSHSESVNIEFWNEFEEGEIRDVLARQSGLIVVDNPPLNGYPTPLEASGRDEVFVGRIRRDLSHPQTLNCWIVADNLRKGAATNAVQIAKYIRSKGWIQEREA